MRSREFLPELINRADDIEHFKNRIKVAAQLCERIGDHPLIFRAFKHRVSEVLLLKVDNSDTMFAGIKGGIGKRGQDAILSLLDIKMPVFAQMTPHDNVFQFHGRAGIFIPVDDVTPYWSPRIIDLGGQTLVYSSEEERMIMQNNSGAMLDDAEKWAATYVHAWPTEFIKNELTVKPFTQNSYAETKSFPIYQESEKKIYVPRCWGIKMFGYPKLLKISFGESINLTFNGQLRDYQTKVLNEYLKAIDFGTPDNINKGNGTALIELWTGAGKTVLGLKIIEVLKKKTIIFVHKTFLKNQWVERIEEYLPGARIGTIQGQIVDIVRPISIVGYQSRS
jgi:hypothetical protein